MTQVPLSSADENQATDNETAEQVDDAIDVDGFTVDKLWDVPEGTWN